jgi:NAD(P)H-nitrite reductase large subunit
MLRREAYRGSIVMLSNDDAAPVDRPNLSKDYLAGNAPEEWIPLRGDDFYSENGIELRLKANVTGIDPRAREVALGDGGKVAYDRLLLATGAEPVRLPIPGADQPHVHTLRSLADSRAIVERAKTARRAVVIGASFIGLEVAASLRARGIEVHVVAPEKQPMERILGAEMGDFVHSLHEEHGVVFHLEDTASAIDGKRVKLKSGGTLEADLVVVGVGVRPRLELAERAGLAVDRGLIVDAYLATKAPEIFAAGDIARWPDVHTGQAIRVEHWVVAERQGGGWTCWDCAKEFERCRSSGANYDVPINYVAPRNGTSWSRGRHRRQDCLLRYKQRPLAVIDLPRRPNLPGRAGDGAGRGSPRAG